MLRSRQKLDKYKVIRRVAAGGFAAVYEAEDTVEGIRVALKIPHAHLVNKATLADFKREARMTSRLDHPHIVPIKTATEINGHFVIVQPLGRMTLHDRLKKRIATKKALEWSEQILRALSHAHRKKVVHCDVKPDNLLLFPDDKLRLADFGIAKVAQRTLSGGGTGSLGFVAPEQAMGKPSLRSDVFSAGLVIWRMLSGSLPAWPYRHPFPGYDKVKRVHPDLPRFLERSMEVDEELRFADATRMLAAFRKLNPGKPPATRRASARKAPPERVDWKEMRQKQCKREFGKLLELKHECSRCHGPVSEPMTSCPWCGVSRQAHRGATSLPAHCPRCSRGVKLDWTFCAWCHGPAVGPLSTRTFTDKRYTANCSHCRGDLMPWSHYCPWCRRKVTKAWKVEGSRASCSRCKWGLAKDHWAHCPWCGTGCNGAPRTGRATGRAGATASSNGSRKKSPRGR